MGIEELKGKTLVRVHGAAKGSERIELHCSDGTKFLMQHYQDCCETVLVEDVAGDVQDIIGSEVLEAYEASNKDDAPPSTQSGDCSYTWTFYTVRTMGGTVTFRWFGESNGYYSEGVDFEEVK